MAVMDDSDLSEQERALILQFMDENYSFFEGWLNGTIPPEELESFKERIDDDWLLINANTPDVVNDKETFLQVWPSLRGKFSEDPITQTYEMENIQKLSRNTVLVTAFEVTEREEETRSRPVSSIFRIDDASENEVKTLYVHE